ncbi:MAG: adenylate/guanylate cyclase domain-containing protein [Deltaproteobacteria bacterium]|nr:adenylate/guanylate cyclase domain-containing protein [Deltaproteobacteria bacterium]
MKTVRAKLVALVLACVLPAVVGAVLRARDAESDLLSQVQRRVDRVGRSFDAEVEEDQGCARTELTLATRDPGFRAALARGDANGVQPLVAALGKLDLDTLVVVSDAQGKVLAASGEPGRAPKQLANLGALWHGALVQGLFPLELGAGQGYALVDAAPVIENGAQVGALALVTPIDADYLEHIETKVNADLAVKVNEKLVASCPGHPDPELESHQDEAVLESSGDKLYALKTFKPQKLQGPNMLVELTASRDVTALRDEAHKDLWRSIEVLAGVLAVVLIIALRFASRMGRAVRNLSSAAGSVKGGKYVTVPEVKTHDELETLATDFNAMVAGLKERDQLRDTFGRYVTRQIADHLLAGKVALGGELVPVTVLFSDIRSFTSISERMEPRALLDFLNEYFSGMVESVMQHHGVVDKFIGDAIMAVFGAPVPHPDDPLHAIQAALEMRARLQKINVAFKARGLPEIRTGIGIHSGQVVAGNMGHEQRMEYTVIGDAVNLASRLESMTKELHADVILSEDLYKQVEASVEVEPLHKIKVKGREQEVMVYKLLGLKGEVPPYVKPPEKGAA